MAGHRHQRHDARAAADEEHRSAVATRQMKWPPIGPRISNASPGWATSWKIRRDLALLERSIASSMLGAPGADAME